MISPSSIALTGLNAASKRIEASASNIANAQTTGSVDGTKPVYMPKDVVQVSEPFGGVKTSIVESTKPPITSFAPSDINADSNGLVNYPNVDLAEELVNLSSAVSQYKSSLQVIEQNRTLSSSLLDIFA